MPSPSTPQNTSDSPPKDRATPRTKAAAKARGKKGLPTPADSSNAGSPPTTIIKTDSPRYAASPLSFSMTSPAPVQPTLPTVVEEEPLSKKRQREAEEALADPDAFIEKTLLGLDKPLESAELLAKDLGSGQTQGRGNSASSSFDFESQLPPVVAAPKPISFASFGVLAAQLAASSWATASDPIEALPTAQPAPMSTSAKTGTSTPFDFELYIDPSAAGFDIDDAPTPDLGSDAPGELSPPSDDEQDDKPGGAPLSYVFGTGQDKGAGNSWSSAMMTLPATFSWTAGDDELPLGNWAIYGEM